MTTTLFHYRYRDAGNYKAEGTIALGGESPLEHWRTAIAKFESGEFFVAEQLDVPPLYQELYKFSGGPTSADHCWHEFVELSIVDGVDPSCPMWGDAEDFIKRLFAVDGWEGSLSPHFELGAS